MLAAATSGRAASPDRVDVLTTRVLDTTGLVRLSHPEPVLAPTLADHNGVSIYDKPDSWRYTSPAIIAREAELLDLTEATLAPAATQATLTHILADAESEGVTLGADKLVMIDTFALSDRALATAVGPAGTGKTATMRYVARAAKADGHTVVGLAPSAVSAKELGDSLSIEASTAQRWLARDGWRDLHAGDMVIIDEAAMMDTPTLASVATLAASQGAVVRMVGDPYQLRAVEAGGAFEMLHAATLGPELEEVFRFHDKEEAKASLALRRGDAPFAWYLDHDRIRGGSPEEASAAAFGAWCRDNAEGRSAIIMADNAERVRSLNDAIAAHRAAAGETSDAPHAITTRDGHTLRIGDTILTRRNDTANPYGKATFVKNGDLFTLTSAHDDGSLTVTARDGSVLTLSSDYTAKHVQLGYAVTVHRAQGVTVDVAHAILDSSSKREAAYVALTRGRDANHLWVTLDDDQPLDAALTAIAQRSEDDMAAHSAAIEELNESMSAQRARDIYLDINQRADKHRFASRITEASRTGLLPATLANPTASPRWANLVRKLSDAEAVGLNIEAVLATVTNNLGAPRDPIALTAWRLERWLDDHPQVTSSEPTAYAGLSDAELADAADQVSAEASTQLRRLYQVSRSSRIHTQPGTEPDWGARPWGHLTDEALTHTYNKASEQLFLTDPKDADALAEAKKTLDMLQSERTLRATMPKEQVRVENDQRAAWNQLPFDDQMITTTRLLSGPYTPVRPHDTIELGAQKLVDDTRAALAKARATATQVALEQDRRTYRAEAPAPADGLSTWAAPPSAITDTHTPEALRDALTQQRQRLAENITAAGKEALANQEWAKNLTRPDHVDPARWQTIVGEVAAYRDTHKVAQSVPLVQTANTGAPGEQPIHNQVTYLAMHTTTPDPAAQARAQADAEATGRSIEQIRNGQALDRPLPAPPQAPVATENAKEDYGPDFGMRMWKEAMRAARAQSNRPNVEHRLPSHDQSAAERDRRRGLRPPTRSGPILG